MKLLTDRQADKRRIKT